MSTQSWELQRADSIGVFQVETRAQMSMLPRLKPAEFYDLVIEAAIVRPGPIRGGMVHPHLDWRMSRHPVSLLRPQPSARGCRSSRQSRRVALDTPSRLAGLVTNRQRPGTAAGIIFMTLEDETGNSNLIIKPEILQRDRRSVLQGRLLIADGVLENRDGVQHVIVEHLQDESGLLGGITARSRDFH